MIHPLRQGIHHCVHLARVHVDLGVGRKCSGKGAKEVVATDRLEFVGQLDWASASFDHGPSSSRKATHICVRSAVAVVPVASLDIGLTAALAQRTAGDIAVAIPLGLALAKTVAVHHSVTREPVVCRRVVDLPGVGAVVQVPGV